MPNAENCETKTVTITLTLTLPSDLAEDVALLTAFSSPKQIEAAAEAYADTLDSLHEQEGCTCPKELENIGKNYLKPRTKAGADDFLRSVVAMAQIREQARQLGVVGEVFFDSTNKGPQTE
jgi:hypothetical protein